MLLPDKVVSFFYVNHQTVPRKWFSGKIQRCHRWAPGSIPGLRISFLCGKMKLLYSLLVTAISDSC